MRFDLVDLQLFIAVADSRSITRGALQVHLALASASARIKGLEEALGVALLKRGRRGVELTAAGESLLDHARIIIHQVDAMRGDLAAYASGAKASVHLLANTVGPVGASAEGAGGLPARIPRHQCRCRGAREQRYRHGDCRPAPPISVLRPSMRCRIISSDFFSAKTAWCWWRHGVAHSRAGARSTFTEMAGHDFVGLTNSTALNQHIAKHAARLGMRFHFRARLRDFDAICQMVAADVGIAVVPEAAARRCARSMPIAIVRIRDPWANRRLVICARSFKSLPRPAKQLVEHLRKAAH